MGVSWGGRIAPDRDQWVNWGSMEKKLEGQAKEGMQTEAENKGEWIGVVGALALCTFPFPEATLSSLHFHLPEPTQV